MGLFSKRMKDPVRGTAQVVAASIPPYGVSGWSSGELDLVVSAEGLEPYAHSMSSWKTPTSKWPYAGSALPVTVDRADLEHIKIEWGDVPTGDELARDQAERIAEAMRSGGDASLAGVPPEAAAIVQQLTHMFPGAAVTVNEPVEPDGGEALQGPGLGGDDDDDRISQLERLAELREDGALTESEFQAEKARILGEG